MHSEETQAAIAAAENLLKQCAEIRIRLAAALDESHRLRDESRKLCCASRLARMGARLVLDAAIQPDGQ
jgi:hypothetical protein